MKQFLDSVEVIAKLCWLSVVLLAALKILRSKLDKS
jgi:hypothetical protein